MLLIAASKVFVILLPEHLYTASWAFAVFAARCVCVCVRVRVCACVNVWPEPLYTAS
jgi:hypothetical protein